ncbi:MAG: hypothetical protein JO246_03730 [Frankiaceae bacterium]|nr:hypothetical protein [Frankiaceae bacterium]MBV9871046.1 hypothetical protein [Frankiaceae bacterium]
MSETTRVIRPAAILRPDEVERVLRALEDLDVGRGGVWITNPGLWQRYDHAWDGVGGMAGTSKLVGTVGAAYGQPTKYEITIYRVTVTDHGIALGWTVESLCNDALAHADLTLDSCSRAELTTPPAQDPFKG